MRCRVTFYFGGFEMRKFMNKVGKFSLYHIASNIFQIHLYEQICFHFPQFIKPLKHQFGLSLKGL